MVIEVLLHLNNLKYLNYNTQIKKLNNEMFGFE